MAALAGHLHPGTPTVGTRVELEHLRPTPVGGSLTVTADLVYVDGRLVRFDVTAYDAEGALVGQAQITHVRVERDRFLGGTGAGGTGPARAGRRTADPRRSATWRAAPGR